MGESRPAKKIYYGKKISLTLSNILTVFIINNNIVNC